MPTKNMPLEVSMSYTTDTHVNIHIFTNDNLMIILAIYILKCVRYVKVYMHDIFQQESVHVYYRRFNRDLQIPLASYKENAIYKSVLLYANLSTEFKNCISIRSFKNKLKTFMIRRVYYTVN